MLWRETIETVLIYSPLNLTMMKSRSFLLSSGFLLLLTAGSWNGKVRADPEKYRKTGIDETLSRAENDKAQPGGRNAETPSGAGNNESLQSCCEKLMSAKRSIYYLNARSYRMALQLRSVYTRNETIFFCLGLFNHSHIDYGIDSIRFYVADEKQPPKRMAFGLFAAPKGAPLIPVCVCGNTRMIRGKTRELYVFALPKFTLAAKKLLVIDISERNGGRHLQLLANNYTLVRARLI
jgi:hypothetical protein